MYNSLTHYEIVCRSSIIVCATKRMIRRRNPNRSVPDVLLSTHHHSHCHIKMDELAQAMQATARA